MSSLTPPGADRFEGCLLGLMAGDCLGLPREGLPPKRASRMFGAELRHAFIAGRGMASDDTELSCFTAQSILASSGSPEAFAEALAWKLQLWFLGLPAGIGLATLRSIIKLWFWWSPAKSGVFSAGNGAAIRAPVIGVACWDDEDLLCSLVRASTRITHTDPKAERAALAVALAARYGATHDPADFSVQEVLDLAASAFPTEDDEAQTWLKQLASALKEDRTPEAFARRMGFERGVSGYAYHTVPAVLWAWLSSPFDFKGGLQRVVGLGGDADTTGAIFGGLCGASAGAAAIPKEWIDGIVDFPRSAAWVRRLSLALYALVVGKQPVAPLELAWPLLAVRNLVFLAVVLAHGFRRMFPPY